MFKKFKAGGLTLPDFKLQWCIQSAMGKKKKTTTHEQMNGTEKRARNRPTHM